MTANNADRDQRAAQGRLLIRVMGDFVLRFAEIVRPAFGYDTTLAMVFLAIMQANVRHVTQTASLNARYVGDESLPDEMRRPISVRSLGASLDMPPETARRYVNKLIKMGAVENVGREGVRVPEAAFASDISIQIAEVHVKNIRRMLAQLRDAGYDLSKD